MKTSLKTTARPAPDLNQQFKTAQTRLIELESRKQEVAHRAAQGDEQARTEFGTIRQQIEEARGEVDLLSDALAHERAAEAAKKRARQKAERDAIIERGMTKARDDYNKRLPRLAAAALPLIREYHAARKEAGGPPIEAASQFCDEAAIRRL